MELSAKAIDMVAEEIKKRGISYDDISASTLLSKSTISRVVSHRKASPFTIKQLVAYLEVGEAYRAIVGDEPENPTGCQAAADLIEELAAVRTEWQQRLAESTASYEDRIQFYRDHLLAQQEERSREREALEKSYERTATHLKGQIERLERNNDMLVNRLLATESETKDAVQRAIKAEEARKQVESNRHQVFIFFAIILAIMAVAIVIALTTEPIIRF